MSWLYRQEVFFKFCDVVEGEEKKRKVYVQMLPTIQMQTRLGYPARPFNVMFNTHCGSILMLVADTDSDTRTLGT